MVIRTYVPSKKVENEKINTVIAEEVKKEEFVPKRKNKKINNASTAIEETKIEVTEEEKIDLSEWLKDETEE